MKGQTLSPSPPADYPSRMGGHGRVTGAVVAAILVASACGGDDGGLVDRSSDTIPPISDDSTATTVPDDPSGSTTSTTSTPIDPAGPELDEDAVVSIDETASPGEVRALVRTIEVGQTARYAGFGIEVLTVDLGFDPAGFRVAQVGVRLTNDTARVDRLQTAVEIESGGTVFVLDRDLTPEVPAGGTADGSFSVRLDESFTSADAVLLIGRPDRQRVSVPLGGTGELELRTPQLWEAPGGAEADGTGIEVTLAEVRWDTADPRGQAEPGTAFVRIDYVLDSAVGTAVNDDTIALADEDGRVWAPVDASIGAIDPATPTELTATFVVDEPVPAELVLQYRERFGNGELDVALSLG